MHPPGGSIVLDNHYLLVSVLETSAILWPGIHLEKPTFLKNHGQAMWNAEFTPRSGTITDASTDYMGLGDCFVQFKKSFCFFNYRGKSQNVKVA